MDDLISEFLTEAGESLSVLDQELVRFEQTPNDRDILKNIFRVMHTIKGTCGFLGLPRLEKVAHAGEDVLGKFRDGDLEVTAEAVTPILLCIDRIREILQSLEATGKEAEGNDEDVIARLRSMAEGKPAPVEVPVTADVADYSAPVFDGGFPVAAEMLAEVEAALAAGVKPASDEEIAFAMKSERDSEAAKKAPAESAPAPAKEGARDLATATQTIRVNVEVLENLMTLVSEMVLTRNNLLQLVRGQKDSEFANPLQRLSLITTDLQEGIMKTRMQPIGNAWSKLPRLIRDLAIELGKKIDLTMIGAETELDRQVLEKIKDPLTHMVRNSADHGMETPDERVAAGKTETGNVTLRAFHEGGHIIIEISDDGRGLNVAKIRKKIVEKGLATDIELATLSDAQVQQYIMRPGFSTADKVTNVSGRGVGMDVVKTNIEEIGGTIQFKSVEGKGSVFTIKIPLTLAIVSALIVECSDERFAIPQLAVRELVRVTPTSETRIERVNNSPVLRLRNRLLPLISLRDLLKLETPADAVAGDCHVVVTQVGSQEFGLIVDSVFDTEEIVVKPVASVLRHISYYSGNTILGDGSVIMILDPNGVAAGVGTAASPPMVERDATTQTGDRTSALLIFRAGGNERKAVPMTLVARLEDIDMTSVEQANGRRVVQYRNHLMPLLSLDSAHEWPETGKTKVLVFTDRDRSMGLVVDDIIDIVDERVDIEIESDRDGVIGSAIIAGKATEIVDIAHFLTQVHSDWFGSSEGSPKGAQGKRRRILMVEDSPFFRSLIVPYLDAAGFEVFAVGSAEEGLKALNDLPPFDVVVSDIELPGMSGFEFAQQIRQDERWNDLPLVALSSNASRDHVAKGRACGFADFIAKTKRQDLLQSLNKSAQKMGEAA